MRFEIGDKVRSVYWTDVGVVRNSLELSGVVYYNVKFRDYQADFREESLVLIETRLESAAPVATHSSPT